MGKTKQEKDKKEYGTNGKKSAPPKRKERYPELKKENKNATKPEISKMIKDTWDKELDQETKDKYEQMHQEQLSKYNEELKVYEDKHGKIAKNRNRKKKEPEEGDDDDDDEDHKHKKDTKTNKRVKKNK